MRDIAAAVGIKQSSLYKHYASKQDIFDTLVETMQEYFGEAYGRFQTPKGSISEVARQYAEGGSELIARVTVDTFLFYLRDEYAGAFRRLLSIERCRNSRMGEIYREMYIDSELENQTSLFTELTKQGYISERVKPELMAVEFFSPVYMQLCRCDCCPESVESAIELIKQHVEEFCEHYIRRTELC